jgi:hypothetical protein
LIHVLLEAELKCKQRAEAAFKALADPPVKVHFPTSLYKRYMLTLSLKACEFDRHVFGPEATGLGERRGGGGTHMEEMEWGCFFLRLHANRSDIVHSKDAQKIRSEAYLWFPEASTNRSWH